MRLNEQQYNIFKFWLPPLVSGTMAWLLLYFVGQTPLIRATGLALVIVGMALALRRMGSLLAIIGGLTLCLSPAFWSQTGGGEGDPATIVIAIGAAFVALVLGIVVSKRPYIGLGIGVIIFVAFFFSQIGTPRSIRLTAFVTSWLLYLLIDMLLLTNPHPEENIPPILLDKPFDANDSLVRPYHTLGILLLLAIGVLNDPLLTLLSPAIILGLVLTRTKLAWWYWVLMGIIVGVGIRGLVVDYLQAQAHVLLLDNWRDASRWIAEVRLIISQFGIGGVLLATLGLARLSRWYPPLGTVTLVGYAAYTFFGLVYIGERRELLLLPLFVIQVLWMTYAVFSLSEWVKRAFPRYPMRVQTSVQIAYAFIPMFALISLINV